MSKILKSFCCSILFVALSLCGSSAVDYLSFNNHRTFECSKCRKQVSSSLDMVKQQGGAFDIFFNGVNFYNSLSSGADLPSINLPNLYLATVRSDNKNFLMCPDCASEDLGEQIKLSVKEFYPGFNFSNPNQRDIDNLLQNNDFIQKIPMEYRYNVKGFEDGKCNCCICPEGSEKGKIDVFGTNDYFVCVNCGNLFHTECAEDWIKKNFNCPRCKCTSLFKNCKESFDNAKKLTFRLWVRNGCSCPRFSDVVKNAKDMRYFEKLGKISLKYQDRLQNNDVPDEFLEALLPRAVPESKCSRFCSWLRSFCGC